MAPLPLSKPILHETETMQPVAPTSLTTNPTPPEPSKKKRKTQPTPHILHASTFRRPLYTYFHFSLLIPTSPTPSSSLDPLTVSQLLTSALTQYFGLTGAAIPIDILKTEGNSVWIRVPRRDGKVLRAGVSGWVGNINGGQKCGWRVVGEGGMCLGQGDGGMGVFGD